MERELAATEEVVANGKALETMLAGDSQDSKAGSQLAETLVVEELAAPIGPRAMVMEATEVVRLGMNLMDGQMFGNMNHLNEHLVSRNQQRRSQKRAPTKASMSESPIPPMMEIGIEDLAASVEVEDPKHPIRDFGLRHGTIRISKRTMCSGRPLMKP